MQSVTTFAGRLGAYEETIRGLLVWVQNTFGIDTATAEQLVQMVGTALQNWFGGLSRGAARAAADFVSGAAGAAGNAVVALAASIYLLSGKEALLRAARACLHAALPPRAAGSVLGNLPSCQQNFSAATSAGSWWTPCSWAGETFCADVDLRAGIRAAAGRAGRRDKHCPGAGAVPRCGAGTHHPAAGIALEGGRICHHYFVVQQVDGNFIAPRILGGATGLPGLGVLLAIVVGGAWFGIPGMVLGVPTRWRAARCSNRLSGQG